MAAIVFEDLSGTATPSSENDNPYQPLIDAANNDPLQIQARYTTHRTSRIEQQKAKLLDPSFSAWTIDPILAKLVGPNRDPTFKDDRNCIVFWGRPPRHIRDMIADIQQEIKSVAPDMWFMPPDNLHITVLEVIFSVTAPEVDAIVSTLLQNGNAETIANTTSQKQYRPRLVKPMIGFDAAAMALSFVPAAGEGGSSANDNNDGDEFTYHHLRRDIYNKVVAAGVKPVSRYAVPSAHLTIGRFINQNGFLLEEDGGTGKTVFDHDKVKKVVEKIEELNARLQERYWPATSDAEIPNGGEWTIGQEKGLDFRKGTLWYGGGETVLIGKGH